MELSAEDVRDFHEMRDRVRIQDLLHREARAIDTRDWALWHSCFTEDADIDWRENGAIRGRRDEVGAWFIKVSEISSSGCRRMVSRLASRSAPPKIE